MHWSCGGRPVAAAELIARSEVGSTLSVVSEVHQLSRADARRIAVRAQLLHADRPTDLLDLVRHLTVLQVEPTAAIAPSAEVVCVEPVGRGVRPGRPGGGGGHRRAGGAAQHAATGRGHRALPGRDGRLAGSGRADGLAGGPARLAGDQRRLPPRHPREALRRGAAAVARAAGHDAAALGVERLEQRPQPADAARADGQAGRGGLGRLRGSRAAVGPGRAGLPRRSGRAAGGGAPHPGHPPARRPSASRGRSPPRRRGSPTTSARSASPR